MGVAKGEMASMAAKSETQTGIGAAAFKKYGMIAGGAITGIGAMITKLGMEEEQSQARLKALAENQGISWESLNKTIEQHKGHMESLGYTTQKTMDAYAKGLPFVHSAAEAEKLVGVAADFAAATHKDLNSSVLALARGVDGGARALRVLHLNMALLPPTAAQATKELNKAQAGLKKVQDEIASGHLKGAAAAQKLHDAEAAVKKGHDDLTASGHRLEAIEKMVETRTKGVADAMSHTLQGRLNAIKAKVEDFAATAGQKFGPALTAMGVAIMAASMVGGPLITMFRGLSEVAGRMVLAGAEAVSGFVEMAAGEGIAAAAGAALDAVLSPILIVILAVAAAALAVWFAIKHWHEIVHIAKLVWEAVKHAFEAGINWIKEHWKELLLAFMITVLTGGMGLIIMVIIKHWAKIKELFMDGVNWVKHHWQLLLRIMIDIVTMGLPEIIAFFVRHWSTIKRIFGEGIGAVVRFFQRLPGQIMRELERLPGQMITMGMNIVMGIVHGIEGAIGRVIGAARHIVSAVTGTLGKLWNMLSPSKVTQEMGHNLVLGLVNGMNAAEHRLKTKAADLAGTMSIGLQAPRPVSVGAPTNGGGGTVVIHQHVAGNILVERQAAEHLRDLLIQFKRRNPTADLG